MLALLAHPARNQSARLRRFVSIISQYGGGHPCSSTSLPYLLCQSLEEVADIMRTLSNLCSVSYGAHQILRIFILLWPHLPVEPPSSMIIGKNLSPSVLNRLSTLKFPLAGVQVMVKSTPASFSGWWRKPTSASELPTPEVEIQDPFEGCSLMIPMPSVWC